jgi:hypothetical protein
MKGGITRQFGKEKGKDHKQFGKENLEKGEESHVRKEKGKDSRDR